MIEPIIFTIAVGSLLPLLDGHTIMTIASAASGVATDPVVVNGCCLCINVAAIATVAYTCYVEHNISALQGAEILHFLGAARQQFLTAKKALIGLHAKERPKGIESEDEQKP